MTGVDKNWAKRQNAEQERYRRAMAAHEKYRRGEPLTVGEDYLLRKGVDYDATDNASTTRAAARPDVTHGVYGEYHMDLRQKAADKAAASQPQAQPRAWNDLRGMYGMPDMSGVASSVQSIGPHRVQHNVPRSKVELDKKRAELEWLMMEMQKQEMYRRMNDPNYGSDPGDEIRRLLKSQLSTT